MLSYTIKRLRIDITLGEGTFDGTNNTKSFSGLEMSVNIEKPGAPDKNKAKVTITGMALDDMRQMTMLAFKPLQRQKNLIAIYAGDDQSGMNMCFAGEITTASADFSGAPTIKMNIEAAAGAYPALKASSPVAVSGSQTAAELVEMFAKEAGYAFENKGVTASVKNAVFNGDPVTKAQSVARQVGAELIIDDNTFVLLPWDKGRNGDNAVKMSPDAGMVGYPSFGADGISLKCFYNPALELGGLVEVTSVVPGASGTWKITKLTHKLVANSKSAADWFSELEASPIGYEKKKA